MTMIQTMTAINKSPPTTTTTMIISVVSTHNKQQITSALSVHIRAVCEQNSRPYIQHSNADTDIIWRLVKWTRWAILNFANCWYSISVLDEYICTKFGTNMQHDNAKMPTSPKTEPEVNLHDVIDRTLATNVRQSRIPWQLFQPNLVESSRIRLPPWRMLLN